MTGYSTRKLIILLLFLRRYYSDYYSTLGVSKDASDKDIKKSYRRLALDLHPDKISQNETAEFKEVTMNRFIEVQQAYEALSDPEKRVQYDLSQDGVQYDIVKENEPDRYTSNPFSTFISSKRFKFYFSGIFKPPPVPDLNINLHVDLKHVYVGVELKHTFYRRVVCPTCGGNGGKEGQCRTCSLCGGSGHTSHLSEWQGRGNYVGNIRTMTHTRCGTCKGKGCIPNGVCETCQGIGTKMQETDAIVSLPIGFSNGYKMTFEQSGHQRADGTSGVLNFNIWYRIPNGWRIEDPLNLRTELATTLDALLNGFEEDILTPAGETIHVSCPKGLTMANISEGISYSFPDMGLQDMSGHRGSVIVDVTADLSRVEPMTILNLLQASGLDSNSRTYRRILALLSGDVESSKETNPMFIDPSDVTVRTSVPEESHAESRGSESSADTLDEIVIQLDGPL